MSTSKYALPTIKYDGKIKWEEYDYELKSCLLMAGCKHLVDAPYSQQSVVARPNLVTDFTGGTSDARTPNTTVTSAADGLPQYASTETKSNMDVDAWDTLNVRGLAILKISISFAVAQCLPTGANAESLFHCYYTLRNRYRQVTASSTSIECHRYFTTIFDDSKPFLEQIDSLDETYARIVAAGMTISESMQAMRYISALPPSYDAVRENIGSSIDANLSGIKPSEIRTRILAAETLRNNSTERSTSIAAIHRHTSKCGWCNVSGHTENDCRRKHHRKMTKDEARLDALKVRKEKEKDRRDNKKSETPAAAAGISIAYSL